MESQKTRKGLPTTKENTYPGAIPLTPSELKALQEDMDQAGEILMHHFPGIIIEPFEEDE